jgi:hypothetical protein
MAKKLGVLLFVLICINLSLLSLISAIDLDIGINPVQKNFITDLDEPAVLELKITNLGDDDTFQIYSLVGVDIKADKVFIKNGEVASVKAEIIPNKAILPKKGPFIFEYKIKNSKNEIQTEQMTINIVDFKDAVSITSSNINPKSEKAIVTVENNINLDFPEIKTKVDTAFFSLEQTFPLKALERKEFEVPLNLEKLKTAFAGSYLLNAKIETRGVSVDVESIIKFLEQEDIETSRTNEGLFIRKTAVTETNVGNTAKTIDVEIEKNIISYLFTTFNIAPSSIKRSGFKVTYSWKKELIPNEKFELLIKTNWFYPILIILIAVGLIYLIKRYIESDLILTKKVSYIKTRGGEFALKITLRAKAKKFIERIHVVDKLPHLVELYERFGTITPDKIDLKNKRLEWNIESLNKKEERIFSYIVYSKIGVVGKFELPCAKAFYERNAKVRSTESNRSFFINEPKKEEV